MNRQCWIRALGFAVLLVALTHNTASAGMIARCGDTGIFPDSDVTVYVLPYVDDTSPESSRVESPVGTELAGLIHADTLLAISRFGHVAAIRLTGNPTDCEPNLVFDRLKRKFSSVRPEHAIVMLWGRIFRVENEIYVQSYASFRRFDAHDPGEMIQFPFGDRVLAAQLATQALTFAPRHVSVEDLKEIRDRFAIENIVHQRPNEQSPGEPLLILLSREGVPAYYVIETQGNWIHIHTLTGQDGWILASAKLGQESLSRRLPEMRFVEGVVGYFGFRAHPTAARAELADSALVGFEESPLSAAEPTPIAVSKQLRGMIQLLAGNQSDEAFMKSASLLAAAAEVLPSSSSASNIATVVWVYGEWKLPSHKLNFQKSVNKFWVSISADPHDITALTNCWTLYTVAGNPAFRNRFTFDPQLSEQQLNQRAQGLESVQLGGSQVRLAHAVPVAAWPKP